ncbi:MAG: DUF4301 family protein [Bacteroidia bacterium]|nr:DUF4301 family protein [Bacteroidia bacterium]
MFSAQDLQQIQSRGSQLATVEEQIQYFVQGFPFLQVLKAATVGDGIIRLSDEETDTYAQAYTEAMGDKKVVKFVPASGAASRMFQALYACMNADAETQARMTAETGFQSVGHFMNSIRNFAFYPELAAAFPEGDTPEAAISRQDYTLLLRLLLTDAGLGYGQLPKGLLTFHAYEDGTTRTPAEEHIVEGANYCAAPGGTVYLHLTVSPEHQEKFEALVSRVQTHYEAQLGIRLDISFSEQKPATDTIAVDGDNQPFRQDDGSLLFRPAGHGALIENLNDISADVIFVKNIDNVVPDRIKGETFRSKKALAGILLETQRQIFAWLEQLEGDTSAALLSEAETFIRETLCTQPPAGYETWGIEDRKAYVMRKLDRPLRVCGMVKNEGEPGGGPFWALNPDGTASLQIAESAQLDKNHPEQAAIAKNATHFNPVDLVCATRDRHGNAYHLPAYRDPQTGFIASKSKDGRELKAQELPGLWNGAMSDWNTLFVEVPIITFNPVKTVNDLLRAEHQG